MVSYRQYFRLLFYLCFKKVSFCGKKSRQSNKEGWESVEWKLPFHFSPQRAGTGREGGFTPGPNTTPGATEQNQNQERPVTWSQLAPSAPGHRGTLGQEFSGKSLHCLPARRPLLTSSTQENRDLSVSTPVEWEHGPSLTMCQGCAKETTPLGCGSVLLSL